MRLIARGESVNLIALRTIERPKSIPEYRIAIIYVIPTYVSAGPMTVMDAE